MTEYKIILKDWYKRTIGGSSVTSIFEDWLSEKCNTDNIDPAVYDRSDIKMGPSILIDNYAKKKKYLTMIFLWDEVKEYIRASKCDPLKIGMGEAGLTIVLDDDDISAIANSVNAPSGSQKSGVESHIWILEEEAKQMVQTVVSLVTVDDKSSNKS